MSHNPCVLEALVMTKYCRLLKCPDCGEVQFNLPCGVSLRFEISRFLEIADAFALAAKMLNGHVKAPSKLQSKITEIDRSH